METLTPGDGGTAAAREDGPDLQQAGQDILAEACRFLGRFTILPSDAACDALVLFAAHCWIYRAFSETPRMHITSLEYGAGKTRVLRLTSLLCPNPQQMARITGPAIYHIIPERHPAPLCLDEADAMLGSGRSGRAEDVRGILNAGYEASGVITRVVGGEAADFSVFCPVMLAGKGALPQSLADRSISISMRKRARGQHMDRYVPKMHEPLGKKTGLLLGAWASQIAGPAGDILWEDPPEGLADRHVDILTPLYAIAAMAGGPWPQRFTEMVNVLMLGGVSTGEVSPVASLLSALRDVWPQGRARLASHELADLLAGHESGEFAWPQGQRAPELNARMRDLGVPPEPMRIGGQVMRGYDRAALEAEWQRLPVTLQRV
jgi:hypothetical protein